MSTLVDDLRNSYRNLAAIWHRIADDPEAGPGHPGYERMMKGMAYVELNERPMREAGLAGCIFGLGESCSKEQPMVCEGCMRLPSQQGGFW